MAPRVSNPCTYLPRRLQIVSTLAVFLVFTFYLFGSSSDGATRVRDELSDYMPEGVGRQFTESPLNPFGPASHQPPPEQANSTSGDIAWFSDWDWMKPWSDTVAVDDRAVLPPEAPRTPVYTYYDVDPKKDRAEKEMEHQLLLTWRRAWWAKGFRPVVLGRPDALNNPLYSTMQGLDLDPIMENDLLRWLAWGNMGTGVLSNWLAFPMCDYDNPMLVSLRRGEFPQLTRYENLQAALIAGEKKDIAEALKKALALDKQKEPGGVIELLPPTTFSVESDNDAIAFYSVEIIKTKYPQIYEKLSTSSAEGKGDLKALIEAHLQSTWQSLFPAGLSVLRPIPESMTAATAPMLEFAKQLSFCLDSPLPSSCPPNIVGCKTCMTSTPMVVETPVVYRKNAKTFTLGTVPHPYTMNSLIKKKSLDSARVIRRETGRDNYILAVAAEAQGTGKPSYVMLTYLKEIIASMQDRSNGLWVTAERAFDDAWREDITWNLGFPIATAEIPDGKTDGPVPGPERRTKPQQKKVFVPSKMPDDDGVRKEHQLIELAKEVIRKKNTPENKKIKKIIEAWNLADTELWNFVRAFWAQRRMEREKWEEEEKRFAGSAERRGTWSKWWDDPVDAEEEQ